MEDLLYKHRKKIVVGIFLVILTLVGIGVYYLIWNSIYCAKVNIVVAPSIAKVKIDGGEYNSTGEFRIKPGEYEAEIYADGFISKSVNITAVKDETVNLYEYLDPTDENANWYNEHDSDADTRSAIILVKADEANRKLAEENPIINVLPVEIEYYADNYSSYVKYNLRYEVNEKGEITIIIDDYSGGNKELALKKLKTLQPDYEKYTIKYNDKTNERLF